MSPRTDDRMSGAVIFVHVPKAAGTSLQDVIARQYPASSIYRIRGKGQAAALKEFKTLPQVERDRIQVLSGHLGYGLDVYLRPPARYVTILRDPVRRVVSHYEYIRWQLSIGHSFADRPWLRDAAQMSLVEYVRNGRSNDLRNGQTRMLAGVSNGWDAENTDHADPADMLEVAKRNIRDGMCVVGLTERFDETLLLLQRRLNWKSPFYLSRNITVSGLGSKDAVAAGARQIIEELNQLDIELHRYAVDLFDEAVAAEGPRWARDVDRFRFLNRRWREWCRVRNSVRYRTDQLLKRARPRREDRSDTQSGSA